MMKMFPSYEREAEALAQNGSWYYSVEEDRFLSYISHIKVSVSDVTPTPHTLNNAIFTMRKLSSVYEVTVKEGFPSSVLLAENLREIVEEYLDITPNLYVVIMDNVTTPIIIGSKAALERLVFPSRKDAHVLKPLQEFLKEGGS